MRAKIVSIGEGLQEYEDIEMIRVKSKTHNLLIMKHYMPLLGELDGYLDIVCQDRILRISGVKGYYMHKKDEFSLLVQEGSAAPVEMSEDEGYVS